jgi:IS30 family transposase
MKYQQLTSHERYIISALRIQGLNQSDIARSLGRHRSTISRELSRNCCWIIDDAYRPSKAQRRTVARRKRTRRNHRYSESDFAIVRTLLRQQFSPEQIVGYLRSINQPSFSHETIYLYIWQDKAAGGHLWTHLRGAQKKRRKRYRAYDSRDRLADKRHISERPKSVESKRVKGH